jgi:hypothetical protein
MPSPESAAPITAAELAGLAEVCAKIQARCAAGEIDKIPDEVVADLLTTATVLYATATHESGRSVPPFRATADVAATWVVVTVKAMLEAVSLTSFDLAMWSNRIPARQRTERD